MTEARPSRFEAAPATHRIEMITPRVRGLSPAFLLFASCIQNPVSLGDDERPDGAATPGPDAALVSTGDDAGTSDLSVSSPGPEAGPLPGVDLVLRPYPGACPVSFQHDTPSFELEVRNQGDQGSGAVLVRLLACAGACDGSLQPVMLFEGRLEAGLAPGQAHVFVEPMPSLPDTPVGPWQLFFVVDPEDTVEESDETNNQSPAYALHNGLRASPSSLNLGHVCVGSAAGSRLTLENVGSEAALIQSMSEVGASLEIGFQPPATPAQLAPGSTSSVDVSYAPTDTGSDARLLLVQHDLSACPLVVQAFGEGLQGPLQTETFQQRAEPSIDVLAIVDDSCSMAPYQNALAAQLPRLHQALVEEGVDFHLGLTTTDLDLGGARGQLLGAPAFLEPSTPGAEAAWSSRIAVGTDGSGLDQGLEASRLALSAPLSGTSNAGFLRREASLLLLYVSDEDDGSAGAVSSYQSFFEAEKPSPSDVRVDAIVTTPGSNCGPAADRYLQLVTASSGRVVDICASDWSFALTELSREGFGLIRSFALAGGGAPSAAELQVSVDGNLVSASAYDYDEATRVLTFRPTAVPGPGATVEVTYGTACP